MTEQSRRRTSSKTGASTLEFDDMDLQSTMQSFLEEGQNKESGKNIWNVSTITGMVMLFLGVTFLLQWVGLPLGSFLTDLSTGLIPAMPFVGGALVTLIGFGYFVGDRKGERKAKKAKRKEKKRQGAKKKRRMEDIPGGEMDQTFGRSGLSNDLDDEYSGSRSSSNSGYNDLTFDTYGYRHQKKLTKSRTDKKWAGVCGGLARYFGISSTVVRFIFVAAFFMGYGTSLLIYFALSLAMPKEPMSESDEFIY